ncbi:MAG: hypothetical protein GXO55_07600 [Chloroflexi bacterium]|nr:hypothetical protein [Chloroflexota bacterium]
MYVLVIGHREEENRFCKTCGPVYTSEQLARAASFFIQREWPLPLEVRHVDAADEWVEREYLHLLRAARREGLRFPLVFLVDGEDYTLLLHGTAEPYAILRALKEHEDKAHSILVTSTGVRASNE